MITKSGEGHIPSAFSIVDIIATLYEEVLKPDDYFILSKGHGCAALYVVLEKHGVIQSKDIEAYGTFTGVLGGHPDRTKAPGVLCSTGSLGHGLPMAIGLALGLKLLAQQKIKTQEQWSVVDYPRPGKVYCLIGDGECHEGTTWEAARVAPHLGLNLTVIVDNNKSAEQLIPSSNLLEQFRAFGWRASEEFEIHSHGLNACVLNTTKGNGVSFLEGHGKWHHKIPNKQEYDAIMAELA